MKKCEKCNSVMGDDAAFCTNCGASLGTAGQPDNTSESIRTPEVSSGADVQASTGAIVSEVAVGTGNDAGVTAEVPSKKKGTIIALIIAGVVCLAVGITGIVMALMNNNSGSGGTSGNSSSSNKTPSGGGSSAAVEVPSGVKVSFAGFEFTIPNDYEYEVGTGADAQLSIVKGNDYMASISYGEDITFASIESDIDLFAETFSEEFGMPVTGSVVNAGGEEFAIFNGAQMDGFNVLYAYSEAAIYPFQTIVLTNSGVDGAQYLDDIAEILGSAQKKTSNRATGDGSWGIDVIERISGSLSD